MGKKSIVLMMAFAYSLQVGVILFKEFRRKKKEKALKKYVEEQSDNPLFDKGANELVKAVKVAPLLEVQPWELGLDLLSKFLQIVAMAGSFFEDEITVGFIVLCFVAEFIVRKMENQHKANVMYLLEEESV